MIDGGPEAHLTWVVFMDTDGACWTVPNPEVRMQANWSMQRRPTEEPIPVHPTIHTPPDGSAAGLLNGFGDGETVRILS